MLPKRNKAARRGLHMLCSLVCSSSEQLGSVCGLISVSVFILHREREWHVQGMNLSNLSGYLFCWQQPATPTLFFLLLHLHIT